MQGWLWEVWCPGKTPLLAPPPLPSHHCNTVCGHITYNKSRHRLDVSLEERWCFRYIFAQHTGHIKWDLSFVLSIWQLGWWLGSDPSDAPIMWSVSSTASKMNGALIACLVDVLILLETKMFKQKNNYTSGTSWIKYLTIITIDLNS